MKIKHVLASRKDKKATILHSQLSKVVNSNVKRIILHYKLSTDDNGPLYGIGYHRSRNGKTWYAESTFPKNLDMPDVSKPIIHDVQFITVN